MAEWCTLLYPFFQSEAGLMDIRGNKIVSLRNLEDTPTLPCHICLWSLIGIQPVLKWRGPSPCFPHQRLLSHLLFIRSTGIRLSLIAKITASSPAVFRVSSTVLPFLCIAMLKIATVVNQLLLIMNLPPTLPQVWKLMCFLQCCSFWEDLGDSNFHLGFDIFYFFGVIVDPQASLMQQLIAVTLLQRFLAMLLAFILPMPLLSLQHLARFCRVLVMLTWHRIFSDLLPLFFQKLHAPQRYHLLLLGFVHCPVLLFRLLQHLQALFLDLRQVQHMQLLDRVVLELALQLLLVKCDLAFIDRFSLSADFSSRLPPFFFGSLFCLLLASTWHTIFYPYFFPTLLIWRNVFFFKEFVCWRLVCRCLEELVIWRLDREFCRCMLSQTGFILESLALNLSEQWIDSLCSSGCSPKKKKKHCHSLSQSHRHHHHHLVFSFFLNFFVFFYFISFFFTVQTVEYWLGVVRGHLHIKWFKLPVFDLKMSSSKCEKNTHRHHHHLVFSFFFFEIILFFWFYFLFFSLCSLLNTDSVLCGVTFALQWLKLPVFDLRSKCQEDFPWKGPKK